MFELLSLIIGKKYWRFHSWLVKYILYLYGIKAGKRFYIEGVPKLKIRGLAQNILIGDDVSILGGIDLRNRENGRIIIGNNVMIEHGCRIVSARDGTIRIGEGSVLTCNAIINGGADVIIGKKCVLGPRSTINANEHEIERTLYIRDQGFIHRAVILEDDCWIGANVVINKGVTLAVGTVVGANAVVTKSTEAYSINAGVPAVKIGERG